MNNVNMVSVVDCKMVNINAALVFYHNWLDMCSGGAGLYLLTCGNALPAFYADYFRALGVEVIVYDMPESVMSDDPYRVKYLLKYFVDEVSLDKSEFVYLDPDHIIQKELFLNSFIVQHESRVVVSSEVKIIEKKSFCEKHLNTSLIVSTGPVLQKVFSGWLNEYEMIRDIIGVRFREEIAMVNAAYKNQVPVAPCDPVLQCTVDAYLPESVLCHYGGTSQVSGKIKYFLNDTDYQRIRRNFDLFECEGEADGGSFVAGKIKKYITEIQSDLA